jgi:hypothetical protein
VTIYKFATESNPLPPPSLHSIPFFVTVCHSLSQISLPLSRFVTSPKKLWPHPCVREQGLWKSPYLTSAISALWWQSSRRFHVELVTIEIVLLGIFSQRRPAVGFQRLSKVFWKKQSHLQHGRHRKNKLSEWIPSKLSSISWLVAFGFSRKKASETYPHKHRWKQRDAERTRNIQRAITIPGVQNPHWEPWSSAIRFWTGCNPFLILPIPSTVITCVPSTEISGAIHAFTDRWLHREKYNHEHSTYLNLWW